MVDDPVAQIEAEMRATLEVERTRLGGVTEPEGNAAVAPLYGMMRYHLGWDDASFQPVAGDGGKKLRGQLCLLACALLGGDARRALPTAAAVELIHNFTLVHDDIQDNSSLRRHRPAVWTIWGVGQAINVGDGLYALARLTLLRSIERGVAPELVVDLAARCEQALLRVLEGQYLDLSFEWDWAVTVPLYQRMIEGKTASLIGFCLEAGGLLGGGTPAEVEALGRCGRAIGLGFQVRDDILGIWGMPETTGKPLAGDVRARKKSLPVLIAMERASAAEREVVHKAYEQPELDEAAVARVLAVLERTDTRGTSQSWVEDYHDEALAALAAVGRENEATVTLRSLIEHLVAREF